MTYDEIWHQIATVYDDGEAKAISRLILDTLFGMSSTDVYCGKVTQLSAEDTQKLEKIIHRIINSEPVQYVLGVADFAGLTFHVKPGVLIPRPETAELCDWILQDSDIGAKILDIGTGSGCIAITLAKNIDSSKVCAWDISQKALHIARDNAERLKADVQFIHQDVLAAPDDIRLWDIIVSNPPYICEKEKADMEKNVLDYEPGLALFVPDKDPLLFYRRISEYAIKALQDGGQLYFEINPLYLAEMTDMLQGIGFALIETKNDIFGKKRFIKAARQ